MKLIKTSDDHAAALGRLEELMVTDPAPQGHYTNTNDVTLLNQGVRRTLALSSRI